MINIENKYKPLKQLCLLTVITILAVACNKQNFDTTPPGKLNVLNVIPTHGGAKIAYSLPPDNDVLYVKAVYKTSKGAEIFKASSIYIDTIEVEGFNDTTAQNIVLYVVDRAKNQSEGTQVEVNPLVSHIHLVNNSVQVQETFGGVKVSWQNIMEKTVHVKLLFTSLKGTDSVMISRSSRVYSTQIKNLDTLTYNVKCIVEDNYENKTPARNIGTFKPMFEQKIDKSTWVLEKTLSANGDAWEGLTANFWDDIIDTRQNATDNSYFIMTKANNGGSFNYPLDIVINLNKKVVINRFKVWQRDFDYNNRTEDNISVVSYYYQPENVRSFSLYVSNNLETWEPVGNFDIGNPADEDGNIDQNFIDIASGGHEFVLEQVTAPFQYLKFSITANYGSSDNICCSELTLFGVDNVQ